MTDIELLTRRVEALEEAQLDARVSSLEVAARHNAKQIEWMASTLGRVAATQDRHTIELTELRAGVKELRADVKELRADVTGLRSDMTEMQSDVTSVKAGLSGLRRDLPSIVADAMREVLKPGGA